MFTREELEDMWENKPHGYFKSQLALMKNKKRYKITTTAYRLVEAGTKELVVFAKDSSKAIEQDVKLKTELRMELGESQWTSNLRFVTTAKLI